MDDQVAADDAQSLIGAVVADVHHAVGVGDRVRRTQRLTAREPERVGGAPASLRASCRWRPRAQRGLKDGSALVVALADLRSRASGWPPAMVRRRDQQR